VLVVAEVALSLVLLIGAGLMIRTLWQLRDVRPGFDSSNVLTMSVAIPHGRFATPSGEINFFHDVLQRVKTLPGVEEAGAIDSLPLDGGGSHQPFSIEGRPVLPMADQPDIASLSFEAALAELERIVAELESGKAELERSIQVYERGAALKAHCEAKLKEAQLRVELSGNARASVDPSLVGRALTNLLTNAIQHSQPGGTVSVSAQQRGELVFVAVSNVGTPIAPELRMNIFERFYRLDESRSNSGENHGLGLAIVKAVAEMHGGSVFVSCEDGVNTFGFSVAAASAHNAADERPVSDTRRPLRVPEAALLFPASRRRNRA